MSDFHVIIPARYQSTRLPGKPLKLIGNKPMIAHVCERAKESGALSVTVATDDNRIFSEVNQQGYQAVMTSEEHRSGSDRLFEAAEIIGLSDNDIIVNVQGDEPFIPSKNIELVASLLNKEKINMATLACKIESNNELFDPNVVKLVLNKNNQAIYFSRSAIPYDRSNPTFEQKKLFNNYLRHIGIYAYRKSFLKCYIQWPSTQLESLESLEQLRVIENGHTIQVACLAGLPPHGVDTQADLDKAQDYFLSENSDAI